MTIQISTIPRKFLASTLLALLTVPGSIACAQDAPPDDTKPAGAWTTDATMYGWLTTSIETEIKFPRREVSSDLDFGDVLDSLDIGGFAHLETTNGRWGIFTDLMYVKLSQESTVQPRRGPVRPKIDVDNSLEQATLELGGFRRFSDERRTFDLLVGGRYWNLDVETDIGNRDLDASRDWVDPFVGGRFGYKINDKWSSSIRADLGGFGAGSDMTLNIVTSVRRKINESTSIGWGYRFLDVEYDDENPEMDIQMSGPMIGVNFRF